MNNIVRAVRTSVLVCSVAVLTACGGGGGGDVTVTSPLNFSLLSAWQDYTKKSLSQNFTITGDCSGSGSSQASPIQTASGVTKSTSGQGTPIAFSETSTLSVFYSNCSGSGSEVRVMYFDNNYHPIQVEFPLINTTVLGGPPTTSQQFIVYRYTASIPNTIGSNDSQTIGSVDALVESCSTGFSSVSCNISRVGGGDLTVAARPNSADSIFVDFTINLVIDGQVGKNTSTLLLTSAGVLTPVREVIESAEGREVWTN